MAEKWRTGQKLGRTIYRQLGDEPSDRDPLIGVMDYAVDAARVVAAMNRVFAHARVSEQLDSGPEDFDV